MNKIIISIVACFPYLLMAQTDGIQFESFGNWRQVMTKARKENKCIFVDFYATWCGPCKAMDKDVYPSRKLGSFASGKFISVKIQQDRTYLDNESVKTWYSDADSLVKTLNITEFPSLVFFAPDGKVIGKTVGYRDEKGLLTVFDSALNINNWSKDQLARYYRGKLTYDEIGNLALKVQGVGNAQLADSIAMDYKNKYLYRLNDSLLLTKENLRFIAQFPAIISPTERIFEFFLKEPQRMDMLVRPGYSKDIVKYIISKEVDGMLFCQGNPVARKPNWKKIWKSVNEKYGIEYANMFASLSAEIAFYKTARNWKKFASLIDHSIKKYPPEINGYKFANMTMIGDFFQRDDWNLNSGAWTVFLHCNEETILKKALKWSNLSILIANSDNGINPIDQYCDTKANLLYKIGKVKEAIDTEKKAYEVAKNNAEKRGIAGGGEDYLATIEKMKEGVPTWNLAK